MSARLLELVDRFPGQRVLVLGDVMLDEYLDGAASRLSREAPVPVVELGSRRTCPGGAANAAVNASALGANVTLVAPVGQDQGAFELGAALERSGVVPVLVDSPGRATRVLRRVTASSNLLVRFDEGTTGPLAAADERRLLDELRGRMHAADVVILSDYGLGTFTPSVLGWLERERDRHPGVLVVDSRHPALFHGVRPTAAKPNWDEAVELLGRGELDGVSERADGIAVHGERLLHLTGAEIVAVTLDTDGALVFERDAPPHRTYAKPREHRHAIGAGDTFIAALSLALASFAPTTAAAEIAAAAAGTVVHKGGTATCSFAELRTRVSSHTKVVGSPELLEQRIEAHRARGHSIVFTNGCFDLLHRGHATYLNRATPLGDVLVVGVNDDDSVRRLKGADRPINPFDDRAEVLAALSCVDHIVPFSGDSPTDVLQRVRPDLYVKGGDYTIDRLPEAPLVAALGGTVRILPFMEDRSTTGIIDHIRAARVNEARVNEARVNEAR